MNFELLTQLIVNGLIVGLLYGVVGMCFVLVYKSTQIVNFAQGEFLLIGAWVCWALLIYLELPFIVGFLLTMAFMAVFGVMLQMIVLRPMIGEPIISVIMVTIGLSIFFQTLMKWIFGVSAQSFPKVFETESIQILGLHIETAYLMSTVIALIIMVAFYLFFKHSKYGLAMRATAFEQQIAQSLGISVKQVYAHKNWVPKGLDGVCLAANWTDEDHRGINQVNIYKGNYNGGDITVEKVSQVTLDRRDDWLGY